MSEGRSASAPTALVTGAASGIGAAFARVLAGEGHRLILVDRDDARLRSVAGGLAVECEVVAADLASEADVAALEARCRAVDLLVNNAGFGHPTGFLDTPVEAEVAMLRLHTETVLRLALAALPSMIDRGRGGVINTASVLGFFPSSTYSATKAWVINFSQAAARTARIHNVAVTALCPGFTRTGFHSSARMDMSKIPRFMWMDADAVAAAALRDWHKGKALSVPGWQYKTIAAIGRLLPQKLIGRILSGAATRPASTRAAAETD
ncbi:SDR family NAD(P)-dependent oxidoreductase [Glycomyces salinus]|uniref:SDR family NAD(P)-dependent oxidoreductase n=1 Tax=Glycomyces salinus TaxID=980294 RepID=UPI0018EE2D2A|nr:SDR family NAD(P)-dependent oxidoreductase [Glycomyces salinus]